jgi:3-oxoacyl-(acyl-carrier-protein) synthase
MSKRRVVVTGLGIVSPVGNSVREAWDNLVHGRTGVGPITKFDASPLPTRIAAEVKGFNAADWMPLKETRRSDTFIHYGLAATRMALEDAGLAIDDSNADRVGVVVGSGIGGLPMIEENIREMVAKGPRRISPFFVPGSIINMVAGLISIQYGAKGPNVSMVSACTTSTHCVGEAGRMIEYGDADVMIAGGAEACVNLSGVGGFCSCKALSERNDDPATASRPFDKDRDGFVLGEGSGILILEELEHAKKRGARIYAELCGMGMSADANHITAPDMLTQASAPPAIITSASPYSIMRPASPTQCELVVQAETMETLGPLAPYRIEMRPATMLMMVPGTKNGDRRRGPLAIISRMFSSIIGSPPMPEPTTTPTRSALDSSIASPASSSAIFVAASP